MNYHRLKKLLKINNIEYQKNVNLRKYNTMRIDAISRFFIEVETKEKLSFIIKKLNENHVHFIILGNGSNIVFLAKVIKLPIIKITFKDEKLSKEVSLQRNFGVNGEELDCFGTNAKMNEFQAAMGLCNLRHIDEELSLRKNVFERYTEKLKDVKGITLLEFDKAVKQNYAYYPILVDEKKFSETRDELCARLGEKGIYARKYFYPLVSENKEFDDDMTKNTPLAKEYSEKILCLPLYAGLSLTDVDKICDIILQK